MSLRGGRGSKIRQLTDVLHCKLQHYFLATGPEHGTTARTLNRLDKDPDVRDGADPPG